MSEKNQAPVLGEPAAYGMKVVDLLSSKLLSLIPFEGKSYLDVGCGNGAFTFRLGQFFDQVWGVDIEPERLKMFGKMIETRQAHNTNIALMSAEAMGFYNECFDVVTAIEVIEHIPDLPRAMSEINRVLKPKGFLGITCPNRLFPFETHGIRYSGREIPGRFPLLPYFPRLHRQYALARVFSVRELDNNLSDYGFTRTGLDFAFPTFERGNRLGKVMRPLKDLVQHLDKLPLRMFGVSIVAAYQKP